VFSTGSVHAGVATYDEDFTTTRFKDNINTTAWWDTVAGSLTLYPFAPTLEGTYDTPGVAHDVDVSGYYAYVTDASAGLHVIDVSDPSVPVRVGGYNTPGDARGVDVVEDFAYIGDFNALRVIDVSIPSAPIAVGALVLSGGAKAVAVSGDYAYVVNGSLSSGLLIVDISTPSAPVLVGDYVTTGNPYGVHASGGLAFVADGSSGLHVIDVGVPWSPTLVGTYDTPGTARGVHASGQYAYVADETYGLHVIDIGVPAAPTLVGSYDTPHHALDVYVSGNHAFVADYASGGLQLIDVSDPAAPSLAGDYNTPGTALGVFGAGDHAYVTDGAYGLQVLQVFRGDADADTCVGRSLVVDASEDSIFRARLITIEVGDVSWELSADGGTNWQGLTADGNWKQLHKPGIDLLWRATLIWTPAATPAVTHLQIEWSADNVAPPVPTGFTAAYNTGSGNLLSWDPCPDSDFQYFYVYRSTDPGFEPSPTTFVFATSDTSWDDPDYDGWNVYYKITALDSVDNESGPASPDVVTHVSERAAPTGFTLYQNAPNPFNPHTSIRFDVPQGGLRVTLRIYDVGGRLVRILVDAVATQGEKRVTWDGRDEKGQGVASGVYLFRLAAPGFDQTRKMVLLR
jgi:hypothetical protein